MITGRKLANVSDITNFRIMFENYVMQQPKRFAANSPNIPTFAYRYK